ncbi:hypothetical protein HMPREF7215_1552 [Pyramidobacter piscolens W5455]|uniref:Uncharacterized protein n=1 Tax=Pyramidobacter piscolens W5455 TaxID=352165 RepID=A0ABP2HW10_9BACT|nr:hypothetical protein HMPREF7215_1552 [Pyramidobacter piscolens W5455]
MLTGHRSFEVTGRAAGRSQGDGRRAGGRDPFVCAKKVIFHFHYRDAVL